MRVSVPFALTAALAAAPFIAGCARPAGSDPPDATAGLAAARQPASRDADRDRPPTGAARRKASSGRANSDDVRGRAKPEESKGGESTSDDPVERGRYFVHHLAMCIECHTPRTAGGELDRTRLLAGAPMPLQSPFPDIQWGFYAPRLAGLPGGWSEEELRKFLQTGDPPPGSVPPRPPMPAFRMTAEDAEAVVAYLKSLDSR